MTRDELTCAMCKARGLREVFRRPLHAGDRDGDWVCRDCADAIDANGVAIVPITQARSVAIERSIGRELSPMETHLVQLTRNPAPDNPLKEEIDEDAELALVAAFEGFRGAPALPRAKDAKQRAKVGEAIARFLMSARDSDSADDAARRVVAALGPDEALAAAKVLSDWGLALAAYADRAAQRGLKR